jgi:hypothetical protein
MIKERERTVVEWRIAQIESEERGDEEDFQNSFTVGLFSSSLTRISSEKTFKVNKP